MWENGFSVDDGPLRQFEAPENRSFLQSIMQGYVLLCAVVLFYEIARVFEGKLHGEGHRSVCGVLLLLLNLRVAFEVEFLVKEHV